MTASPLPAWLDPLPGAEAMRETDRWAIEDVGIPSLTLMERAGKGLAIVVNQVVERGPITIVCGKGNNGGDGFVAARVLRALSRKVRVALVAAPGEYDGDALENLNRLKGEHEPFTPAVLEGAALVVDALLGTGSSGAPHGDVREAILAILSSGAPIVAADVPSGVDASTGEAADVAVQAVATATFAAAKPGLCVHPGKGLAGEVTVVDIGIPPGAPVDYDAGLVNAGVHELVPRRGARSTKFTSGHVLVVGGSRGLTGAVCLAAEGAMRAGAGYVTALVPAALETIFETRLLEVMTRGLTDEDGALSAAAADAVLQASERGGALVLGSGAGRGGETAGFLRDVAARTPLSLVLDADGLNAHADQVERLTVRRHEGTVLTPHEGELARLLGIAPGEVAAARLRRAREVAARANAIVVLKGDDTIVADPSGFAAINDISAPALATAGTGDVLAGVIAALLAQGMEPFSAACAAVRRHAAAGLLAAEEHGAEGVLARDVIAALPRALGR